MIGRSIGWHSHIHETQQCLDIQARRHSHFVLDSFTVVVSSLQHPISIHASISSIITSIQLFRTPYIIIIIFAITNTSDAVHTGPWIRICEPPSRSAVLGLSRPCFSEDGGGFCHKMYSGIWSWWCEDEIGETLEHVCTEWEMLIHKEGPLVGLGNVWAMCIRYTNIEHRSVLSLVSQND